MGCNQWPPGPDTFYGGETCRTGSEKVTEVEWPVTEWPLYGSRDGFMEGRPVAQAPKTIGRDWQYNRALKVRIPPSELGQFRKRMK